MNSDNYNIWQKTIVAAAGLAFAAGAAIALGLLTQKIPQDKDKGRK